MRDQQRLLEGQIANVEGLLRNAEAERDAERKEVASLRQQISLLQAQQGAVRLYDSSDSRLYIYSQSHYKTLEQAKRQVAEAEKEKNRVVYARRLVLRSFSPTPQRGEPNHGADIGTQCSSCGALVRHCLRSSLRC